MKKILGIVVLGLLLSGNAFGLSNQEIINKYLSNKKLDPVEGLWKMQNFTILIWEENDVFYAQTPSSERCGIKNRGNKISEKIIKFTMAHFKNKKKCKLSGSKVEMEFFSQNNLVNMTITYNGELGPTSTHTRLWPDDIISHNTKYKTEDDIKDEEKELALIVNDAKKTCGILGFKAGSEKFVDCTLKLYTQKIDEMVAEKQARNQQLTQSQQANTTTQSSSGTNTTIIYDPVRDNQNKIDKGMKMLSGKCTLGVDC